MASRLTPLSKILITLLILGGLLYLGNFILNKTSFGSKLKSKSVEQSATYDKTEGKNRIKIGGKSDKKQKSDFSEEDILKVQVFTWGGYAPGIYFNEGFEPTKRSRFWKEYGLPVQFILMDDFDASRQAWIADKVHLLGNTVDAMPTEMERLGKFNPQIVMQVDWSRGGDAIIANRAIKSINDLKGKQVAVAPSTPSQTFLYKMLQAAGMSFKDIKVIEVPSAIDAATAFKSGKVDAAVVWSPDDIIATREVPGSKILWSTKEASHIIADVFIAKKDYVEANREKIHKFYEGWMRAISEINSNPSNYKKAAKLFGEGTGLSPEDAEGAMSTVKFTNHGDNKNFFGLNPSYKGVTGEALWREMSDVFARLGFAPKQPTPWRNVLYPRAVTSANLSGPLHRAEGQKKFSPPTAKVKVAPALTSKPISIKFPTGRWTLGENAKTLIDLQLADIAKAFGNSRIRVEGNTDNVGAYDMNKNLSLKRAESVAKYLQQTYGMDPNRFIIIGNGPDKPVKGCEKNQNEACRAKNRRTEFQLIAE